MDQSYRTLEYEGPAGIEELPVLAEIEDPHRHPLEPERGHRWRLPLLLFALTCVSTFVVGTANAASVGNAWSIALLAGDRTVLTRLFVDNWQAGLTYMAAVMAILLAHEMGHFLQAVRYHVPASLPFFIPVPLAPIGTMGAVIGMQGSQANRKELFDIGLSGPIAGLVVALPILYFGVMNEPSGVVTGHELRFGVPLLMKWMFQWLRPEIGPVGLVGPLNPLLMAGWVGLLITGLNMLPVSQLDGGHVAYALFGRYAHWLARAVIMGAIGYMVISQVYGWIIMLALVMAIGPDHPPTHDDRVPLGWWRVVLGILSLGLSVICFHPNPLS
ncbi:MAG: site-2 protease family protein [Pirellulales bacterium]|nr:site-2 protease family protein [Pirellulales bacterium]